MTYDTQDDHFTSDNTDIRYANKTKLGGKELVYGLDLNNNPNRRGLVEQHAGMGLSRGLPAILRPLPTPLPSSMAVWRRMLAGFGGYAMWNDHLYLDAAALSLGTRGRASAESGRRLYQQHSRGCALLAPRLAGIDRRKHSMKIGTYGMHVRNTAFTGPGPPRMSTPTLPFDTQIDRTLFRTDVLSFRGTYIHENSDLLASCSSPRLARTI